MSLTPSNKHNPCPICGDTSGKCRQGREDQDYRLCMSFADIQKGQIHNGFKCIGHTHDRSWAQFKLDNSQEWSEQQRLEWQRENQRRQQEKAKTNNQRRRQSLTAQERHEQYTRLLSELTLHPDDRADLIRRGLTHEQIELAGFKSIQRYQRLPSQYSTLLPGISRGNRLIIADEGYLCPVRNADGLIVACQVRLRTLPNTETSRYRWLNGGNQTLHLYPDGCKAEGELPLAVFRPEGKPEGIALAEGTGAKPFLVAQRLNLLTIGAAGGQWASSLELFRQTLEKVAIEVSSQIIKIFPDAGDILNPSVMSRWQRVITLLEEWGWSVQVGWWGQTDKTHPDIDELTDYSEFEFINPEEFLTKAKGRPTEQRLTQPEQTIEVTPPNEHGISFKVLRKSRFQLLEVFPELQSEAGKDWLKMQKFTPDHVLNSKYFDWESFQPGTHLAVRSGLGTGKTHHVHNKFLADDAIGANAFGYRNSLLIQFTERGKNWYHLQQDLKQSKDDLLLVADPRSRVAACFDSLIYFQPHHFEQKRLVLDEIEGSFKHLYQSKTAVSFHRHLCKERAGQALANSEAVILLDGNLTDLTVAHAERISGKKFLKIENQYRGNRGKATLYTGTLKFGKDEETGETVVTERRINDYSLLHKMMMEDSEPFICGSDSQEKLEAWHEILRLKGRKVFRLDGSNSNTPEAKKFLADPVKYIQENGIEIVLYSPTAESGLSIDLQGYFKRSYYFFFGVVQTNEQTQFLARLRDPDTHIHVFCQNQGIDSGRLEQTAPQIQEAFLDYTLACSQISLLDVSEGEKQRLITEQALKLVQRSNDPHFQYECHLKARETFERNHLRLCLEYALHTAGYQVEVVAGFKVSQKELEASQEAVQVKKSKAMFEAQPLTDEEANDKARKFDATQQDKTEVARHRLVSRLPGIESKTQTVSKIVVLPQSAVDEIKSGKVSLETAQKLGIPTPEMPNTKGFELGHLPPNFSINQGEGVPVPRRGEVSPNECHQTSECTNSSQNETVQKLGIPTPETTSTQAIDLGHLPLNFSINQGEGVPSSEGGGVEILITETKPIFDPDFIRKVKYQDRAWLSKVELHFLVKHPEIAKLLQQRRWYKKLQVFTDLNEPDCVKRLNLSTYKSDWLKVHTLLEMGIEFFLNPESRWTQDTPEVLEFWEKGKDTRRSRYIGTTVGDSTPCEYIGRVLDKLDVKRKCDRVRNESGEKIRVYRVDSNYLLTPMRSAVYECVQERIESSIKTDSLVLNWEAIVENSWANETAQKLDFSTPEMPNTQAIDLGHLPPNFLINQGEGVPTIEKMAQALPWCDRASKLAECVEDYGRESVEAAIALQDDQPRRQQLTDWLRQLSQVSESSGVGEPLAAAPVTDIIVENSVSVAAEVLAVQDLHLSHLQPDNLIKNQDEGVTESPTGMLAVDQLIDLFSSCDNTEDMTEVAKFYEPEEGMLPMQKEELVEAAILFSPLGLKSRLQRWWDAALYQVRDFWREFEHFTFVSQQVGTVRSGA